MSTRIQIVGPMALLVLLSVILYGGAGSHLKLVSEGELIWRNPAVTGEEITQALQGIWQSGEFRNQVRPVATLFRRVEYRFFDFNRGSYQTIQILLHGLTAALAFLLFRRWLGGRAAPILGGLLFVVHPAVTSSVLYLGGLSEILCTVFVLLSLLSLGGRGGLARSAGVMVLMLLAVLTKEIAFLLPLFVVGVAVGGGMGRGERLRWVVVSLLATGVGFLYRVAALGSIPELTQRIPAVDPTTGLPAFPLLLQSIAGVGVETGLAVVPLRLSHDHSWLLVQGGVPLGLLVVLSIAVVSGSLWILLHRRGKGMPWRPLVLLAILPLLAPALLPGAVGSVASERNLYLALPGWIGLALLAGKKLGSVRPSARPMIAGVAVGVVLLFGVRTMMRVGDFRDSQTLLDASDRAYPNNPQVLFELGNRRMEPPYRDYKGAAEYYRKALEQRPDFPMAEVNLGVAYIGQEELGLALRSLDAVARRVKHARALRMIDARAHYHAGLVLLQQERDRDAALAFERTLLFYPDHLGARGNLGLIYIGAPDYVDRGMDHLRFAIEREKNPDRRDHLLKKLDQARKLKEQYIEERGGTPAELEPPGRGAIGEPWNEVAEEGM